MYKRATWILCLLAATAPCLSAESLSFTGSLNNSEDVFKATFTLAAPDTVTFQTWGFGGGTNAAGQTIAAGGFDPAIALFNGPVATATMAVDGFGNSLADADTLSNPPWSFVGNCPAAGTVVIGTDNNCGDVFMQTTLSAGTYTLVLTDGAYIPDAVFDNGSLSEGFQNFTPPDGSFQTCDAVSPVCITTNGNFALDIVSTQSVLTSVPEPSTLPLLCIGLAVLSGAKRFNQRRMSSHL